jgi:choline dehydrogenase-like flavoprotein
MPESAPCDILIVGSGIMGAAVAQRVRQAHPTATIVMIEAGPVIGPRPGEHLHDSDDPEIWARYNKRVSSGIQSLYVGAAVTPDVGADVAGLEPGMYHLSALGADATDMPAAAVAWNVGGMGVHWTAACPWPWGDEVFDFGDADQWERDLASAQELLHIHPSPFGETVATPLVLGALNSAFGAASAAGRMPQQMPMAMEPRGDTIRRTGPSVIFPPLGTGDDDFFTLVPDTLALEVQHDEGRATGVRVRSAADGERVIAARHVVVCGDTIRTPQLLFASNIRPPALGAYLNEHAFLSGRVLVDAARHDLDLGALPKTRTDEWALGTYWLPHSGPAQPFHGQFMDRVYVDEGGDPLAYSVGLGLYVATETTATNRVVFSTTETDASGLPRATIEYTYSVKDLSGIEAARVKQRELGDLLGSFDPAVDSALLPPGSSLHYTGTVRMGQRDDGTSVCDTQARVWGFDNLYVAGNGVIPTAMVCNTTLTGVITAVRAADTIAEQM